MKVLWLGHYGETSGWGDAAIHSILALDSVGVEVVPVNIPLAGGNRELPPRIKQLEANDRDDADVCVQNILPHHMVATDKYRKNVAYIVTETSTLLHTPWITPLQSMTEIWVPNTTNEKNIQMDLPLKVVKTIPYAFNREEYESVYDSIDMGVANSTYKFYYIGDLNDRKNLEATFRCFHATFAGNPNVSLVLKVGKFGASDEEIVQHTKSISDGVKAELRIFPDPSYYSPEVIIPHRLSRSELLSLHTTCDCYVSTSHGEGWSIPAFEALCMGNQVIAGNEGGPKDFLPEACLIDGTYGPCTHQNPAFPFLGTGREMWFNINERIVCIAMQNAYANRNDKCLADKRRMQAREAMDAYSYYSIGKLIEQELS